MSRGIKKESKVTVISGKEKGKSGRVIEVLKKKNTVLVEGINKYKKHEKPNPKNEKGGIVDKEMPIHISNVKLAEEKPSSKAVDSKEEETVSEDKNKD